MTDHGLGDTSSLPQTCGDCLNAADNDGCGLDHSKMPSGTSGPCAGLEAEVATIMTDHGLGDTSSLPQTCGDCLNAANNDGCGLDHSKMPSGTSDSGGPSAECVSCLMSCPYMTSNNCHPDSSDAACTMDKIEQHCGQQCGDKCSDPSGSSGGSSDGGVCDHVGPDKEPCCSEQDKHTQNTCILAKHPDYTATLAAAHCQNTSPNDDWCCGLSDHTAQAACKAVVDQHDGGDGGDHDGPSPECESCIVNDCDYWKTHDCNPGSKKPECQMDQVKGGCGQQCGAKCSDPSGSSGVVPESESK